MPFLGIRTPNFTPGFGDMRDYIIVCNDERRQTTRGSNCAACLHADVTCGKPDDGEYLPCARRGFLTHGGRFGPHQFNETQNNKLYRPQDNRNLLYVAYFAGGLRVLTSPTPMT